MYLAVGAIVRDRSRQRSGGRVTAIRARNELIDVQWPDGTLSTYTREAVVESLEVEESARLDLFGLGTEL